jgi:multiple sugar transport system permease protein
MGLSNVKSKAPKTSKRSPALERFKEASAPYLFISPFFLGFVIFQLLPIAFSIYLSLADWDGMTPIQFVGFSNFVEMAGDARFWNAFRVTLVITVVCTILGTIGALALAVLLETVTDWLASLLRVAFFLPSVTSVVVIAYVWKQLYNADYGFFNAVLAQVGISSQDWLTDLNLALPSLIIMLIWAGLGWDALIITAGLRSIPQEFYDAAKVDGASSWDEFWHITLPLLRPTLTFVLVTGVIYLWGLFSQPQLLTGGGPLRQTQTIALYLYDTGFRYHRFGYASAMAATLSLVMLVSSYLNFRFVQTEVEY